MAPTKQFTLISDALLAKYAHLIYEMSGISISPQKKSLLTNRLNRRLKATGIKNFKAYYSHLNELPSNHAEWDSFLQEITTHETFLFRDERHWIWFQNEFLPGIISETRQRNRTASLRIWSAACSTGDEAFTVASCIANTLPTYSQWNIKIIGTDIGVGAVKQAQNAEFGERAMRLVPPAIRKRYFRQLKESRLWKPKDMLPPLTHFQRHNLLDPLRELPFDLVILKNVLIYFDGASKKTVIENVERLMRPGSILICGAAEGASSLLGNYQRLEPWLYRRK